MALSNMSIEPRREWTEQGLGFLAIVGYIWCNYFLLRHYGLATGFLPGPTPPDFGYILGAMFLLIILVVLFTVSIASWYVVHEVGEFVCGVMAGMGFDPRPKNRPRGR